MPTPKHSYKELSDELDSILASLEDGGIDIDTALKQYEKGLSVVKQLKTALDSAENRVTKLSQQFKDK